MILWSWTCHNYIFIVITVADRSIIALCKVCFFTWTRDIIHQNRFIIPIRKVSASAVWKTSLICPTNGAKFWIEWSAKYICCCQVEIWIITNSSPMSSIEKFCSSLPSTLRDIFPMIHSKFSISILGNKWWILSLKICL